MVTGSFVGMEDVPFAPGTSPFRIKGVMYIDTLRYFDEQWAGGRSRLIEGLESDPVRAFVSQRFVVGGWYDLFPMLAMQRAAAKVTGTPYLEVIRQVSRWQLPQQFRGIYRFLLKLTTPDLMMRSLPRTAQQYYDFLRVEVRQTRPKSYETQSEGLPSLAAPAYMASTEIAVMEALRLTGAKGVRHRWLSPVPTGREHGLEMVRVTREVSWD